VRKSTLASIIAGNENYEVTQGEIGLDGEDLLIWHQERAHKGVFLRFNILLKFLVSVTNFMRTAINETRKANGRKKCQLMKC
jgi:Fe-S cluster assembly ATP-binding protein